MSADTVFIVLAILCWLLGAFPKIKPADVDTLQLGLAFLTMTLLV